MFAPRTLTLRGRVAADADLAAVFPLFSPEGEKLWVPGWAPESIDPPRSAWAEGQIFRTREASGEAVWIVTRLDPDRHRAAYHRVEPGHYVARIEVACTAAGPGRTEAEIAYSFIGLSEAGNAAISSMTQADYDAKMARWSRWIADHLARIGAKA